MQRPGIRALEAHKSQFTAFVPYGGNPVTEHTVEQLAGSGLVEKIYLLTSGHGPVPSPRAIGPSWPATAIDSPQTRGCLSPSAALGDEQDNRKTPIVALNDGKTERLRLRHRHSFRPRHPRQLGRDCRPNPQAPVDNVPFLRELFKFDYLHVGDLLLCLVSGILSIMWFEALKFFSKRKNRGNGTVAGKSPSKG